jgi:hypothetical protein
MSKKIKFMAADEFRFDTQLKPYPASKALPEWWKDSKPYWGEEQKLSVLSLGESNTKFKKCIPMFDSLTAGYIVPLWTDVYVSNQNGIPSIEWKTFNKPFGVHGELKDIEAPLGYSNFIFKYSYMWMPITPPGYSVLITNPIGYKNLPFHAVTGIIDSDVSKVEIAPPVWLKEGFEGIVEKGTPIVQIIPFKRDNWESEFDFYKNQEFEKNQEKGFASTISNHYKRFIWSKKSYK